MEETTPETVGKISNANKEIVKKRSGGPRLYPEGFQSVRSTLQMIVRLDFDVFNLWNSFKEHMNTMA